MARRAGTLSPVLEERVQFCLRRLRRDAVLQAPNDMEDVEAAVLTNRRRKCERQRQAPGTIGFFLAEDASLRRLNAKRVEQMSVDRYRPHAKGSTACREVDFTRCVGAAHGSVRPDRSKRLIDLPELHVLLD